MNIDERTAIDKLMTTQLDINGYINYAENKGREEGREEAFREMAQALLERGMSPAEIAELTGITSEIISRAPQGV